MENKKIKLESMNFGRSIGKISTLHLKLEDISYSVQFGNPKMIITGTSLFPGGEYDAENNQLTWYLKHWCGSEGFDFCAGDNCIACDNEGKTNIKSIGESHGDKNLSSVVEYVLALEDKIEEQYIFFNAFYQSQKIKDRMDGDSDFRASMNNPYDLRRGAY